MGVEKEWRGVWRAAMRSDGEEERERGIISTAEKEGGEEATHCTHSCTRSWYHSGKAVDLYARS